MSWAILVAAAVLAAVAAAGILRPFRRGGAPALERLADPLEDERLTVLRSLRELEQEHASGAIEDREYRLLRTETEIRAVAVLRALDERDGSGELRAGLRDLRSGDGRMDGFPPARGPIARARARRGIAGVGPALLFVLLLAAVATPLLAGALRNRTPGEAITGTTQGSVVSPGGPLTFFEDRVRRHPKDVAARLDLAQRYLEAGALEPAFQQYAAALRLDPRNAEARAKLGYLLYRGGRPRQGLQAVEAALQVAPRYPEALYFKGLILLQGLDRPAKAAAALRAYLEEAPFGSRRSQTERLLERAKASSAPSAG